MHSNINIWHINKKSWTSRSSYHRKVFFGAGPQLDSCLPGRGVGPWHKQRTRVRGQARPQREHGSSQLPASCLLTVTPAPSRPSVPGTVAESIIPVRSPWPAPRVWVCTRLPPCEGHSWSPTHLARSGGWQVGVLHHYRLWKKYFLTFCHTRCFRFIL